MRNILCMIIWGSIELLTAQTTLYVNQKATNGKQDGSSWDDAYLTIGEALNDKNGDTIKVMGGNYTASNKNDKNESLDVSDIEAIIGGYGFVNNTYVQDPSLFPTVIDGDIGVKGDSTDNSYQLMRCNKTKGSLFINSLVFKESNGINAPSGKNIGGAIWFDNNNATEKYEVIIFNCKFSYNRAQTGGAIYFNKNSNNFSIIPIIKNCSFDHNFSRLAGGGALYIPYIIKSTADSLTIYKCSFLNNFSGENGGAIIFKEIMGNYIIDSCSFQNNYSYGDGGSIFQYLTEFANGKLEIKNCEFNSNAADNSNLAIIRTIASNIVDSTFLAIHNCNFLNNKANLGDGGAIYYSNDSGFSSLDIKKTTFENNRALNDGGAIYIETVTYFKLDIDQSKFINNKAAQSGTGAIFYQAGYGPKGFIDRNEISIANTLFIRNRNAVAFANGDYGTMKTTFDNCTLFNNDRFVFGKSYDPTANYIDKYNTMYIRNCVIWEQKATISTMFYNGKPSVLSNDDYFITNSSVNIGSLTVGSYNADKGGVIYYKYPQFKDTTNNDFSLFPCSPVINKGNRYIIDSLGIGYDLVGNPRIYQDSVDIGAYESQTKCTVDNIELSNNQTIELIPNLVASGAFVQILLKETPIIENYQLSIIDIGGQLLSTIPLQNNLTFEAPQQKGFYIVQLLEHNRLVGVGKLVVLR